MADHTGLEERAFILSPSDGVGSLAGGRIYKTQVPDGVTLPRFDDMRIRPYGIARFQTPYPAKGRSVADGEADVPHTMIFMLTAYAGDADAAGELNAAFMRKLVGLRPSLSASPIKTGSGYSFPQPDTDSRPTRYAEGSWYRCTINLGSASI